MSSEMMQQVLRMIDAEAQLRPAAVDYELAYQVRVAIDRIKFAIRQAEEFGPRTDQMREIGLQLLDALDRLQSAERHFQTRHRTRELRPHGTIPHVNGKVRTEQPSPT